MTNPDPGGTWWRILWIWRALLAHYRQHPAQALFQIIGLSMGVALLTGVRMINDRAINSYQDAHGYLEQQPQFKLIARQRRQTLPLDLFSQIRRHGLTASVPALDGHVYLDDGRPVRILGVDLLGAATLRQAARQNDSTPGWFSPDALALVQPPFSLYASRAYADYKDFAPGRQLTLADGRVLPPLRMAPTAAHTGFALLTDILHAQELLRQPDRISHILFYRLSADEQQWLTERFGNQARLVDLRRPGQVNQLSESFRLNLTAMGLLAFVVGLFISYNALNFAITQRQGLVSRLRAAGSSLADIITALALELILWALLASVIGTLSGLQLAKLLLPGVAMTLEGLFGSDVGGELSWQWSHFFLALGMVGMSTAAALGMPLWRLANTPILWLQQRRVQHIGERQTRHRQLACALLLTAAAAGMWWLPGGQFQALCLVALVLLAATLALTSLLHWLVHGCRRLLAAAGLLARRPILHWWLSDSDYHLGRNQVALMAFLLALATNVGVNTMVGSFRVTLEHYLDGKLNASLYLRPPPALTEQIADWLGRQPGVGHVSRYRHLDATLNGFEGALVVLDNHPFERQSVRLREHQPQLWQRLFNREGVLISESLAYQTGTRLADAMTIDLGKLKLTRPVLGIYYDYGNPAGQVLTAPLAEQPMITTALGVYLDSVGDLPALKERLQQRFDLQAHELIVQQGLKDVSLRVFERTFAITRSLNALTLIVAAIGIFCALAATGVERQRQIAAIKSLGLNQRQLYRALLGQQLLLGGLTALLALPAGLLLAWLLITQVNYHAFGWTMPLYLFPWHYLLAWLTGLFAVALSSLWPLWRLSRVPVINAMRGVM